MENKPHIYASQNPLLTTNNLSILNSEKINEYDAFFFTDQINSSLIKNIKIDDDINKISLAVSMLNNYKIYPANYANKYFDAKEGWIRGSYWFWYNQKFSEQLSDFAFSLNKDDLEIPLVLEKDDNYAVLINSFSLDQKAKASIEIDNKQMQIPSNLQSDFSWYELGNLKLSKGEHSIKLISEIGNIAVGQIVIVPQEKYKEAISNAQTKIKETSNAMAENIVNYAKISPTQYEIEINNNKPFYLIFSENYNSGWKLFDSNGKNIKTEHFKVNSYANAYYINNTGSQKISLEFAPQKYHSIGIWIAGIFSSILLGIIIILRFRQH
jgi:predicted secreted protein